MIAATAFSSTMTSRATTGRRCRQDVIVHNHHESSPPFRNGPGRPSRSVRSLLGVANKVTKTEHAGAKNGGGGYWGLRAEAKHWSNRARRSADSAECDLQLADDQPDPLEVEDW